MTQKAATTHTPAHVYSTHGPVEVKWRKELEGGALGLCHQSERYIEICSDGAPETLRVTLWHEVMELILWDSGLHYLIKGNVKEALCDAVGSYMAAAERSGALTLKEIKKNGSTP